MSKLVQAARSRPLLQVALDLTDLDRALYVAHECARAGAQVIEVGTPLLKSWGCVGVSLFRRVFRDSIVLVDTKTADAARVEIEPIARAGADAVTVLGLSSNEVVEEALAASRELGIDLVIDLIHVDKPVDRALRLADLGAQVFELHVGVDVQRRRGLDARALLEEVKQLSSTGLIVAVAGGIRPENAGSFVEAGARIVVIGGAIYRSPSPFEAAKKALQSIGGSSPSPSSRTAS